MDAEVVMRDNVAETVYDEDGNLNPNTLAPIILLDELFHATHLGDSDQESEHAELYLGLAAEIESGQLVVDNPSIVREIKDKAKKYASLNSANNDSSDE